MKILEKLVLIIYSLLMLVISAIICLIVFRIIDINDISTCINFVLEDTALTIVVLSVAVLFILLSIRCLFFRKRKQIKKSTETDILLENESGRLLISKRAIDNGVKNVICEVIDTDSEIKVTVDIDPASNISTYISVILDPSVKVSEFTVDLQSRIKNQVKENFDLEVKQVNIKIDSTEKVDIKKEVKKKEAEKKAIEESANVIEIKSENNVE